MIKNHMTKTVMDLKPHTVGEPPDLVERDIKLHGCPIPKLALRCRQKNTPRLAEGLGFKILIRRIYFTHKKQIAKREPPRLILGHLNSKHRPPPAVIAYGIDLQNRVIIPRWNLESRNIIDKMLWIVNPLRRRKYALPLYPLDRIAILIEQLETRNIPRNKKTIAPCLKREMRRGKTDNNLFIRPIASAKTTYINRKREIALRRHPSLFSSRLQWEKREEKEKN